MRRDRASRTRAQGAAIAALLCVCFLLQRLVVPLHLAENDHTYPGRGGVVVAHALENAAHVHGGDRHAHEHLGEPEPGRGAESGSDDHAPHPAADHEGPLAVRVTFHATHLPPADRAFGSLLFPHDDRARIERDRDAQLRPRPPPLRAATPLRGPPAIV